MDQELKFSPVTDGLGFHPFSDGLPYAPVTKAAPRPQPQKTVSMGTGAVVAGPIQMAVPTSVRTTRVSVPVAEKPPIVTTTPAPAPIPQTAIERFGFGYTFKRILAFSLDTLLNTSLCILGLSIALMGAQLSPDMLLNPGIGFVSALFLLGFNWALITAQEVALGTTLGKRLFGLALNGNASATFLRAFFFLPSLGFCGVGLIWALFDSKRRCWHDLVVDLQPK